MMKIYLILMVIFSDGTPTLRTQRLVGEDVKLCVGMVWAMMVDQQPGEKFAGHPVKSWSAGCMIEGTGDPA